MSRGDADPRPQRAVPAEEASEAAPRAPLSSPKGRSAASPAVPGQGAACARPGWGFLCLLRSFLSASTGKSFPCLSHFSRLRLPPLSLQLRTCKSELHWFAVFFSPACNFLQIHSGFWKALKSRHNSSKAVPSFLWVLHGTVQNLQLVPSCSLGGPRTCCCVSSPVLRLVSEHRPVFSMSRSCFVGGHLGLVAWGCA